MPSQTMSSGTVAIVDSVSTTLAVRETVAT
jgi:hypothetical protein